MVRAGTGSRQSGVKHEPAVDACNWRRYNRMRRELLVRGSPFLQFAGKFSSCSNPKFRTMHSKSGLAKGPLAALQPNVPAAVIAQKKALKGLADLIDVGVLVRPTRPEVCNLPGSARVLLNAVHGANVEYPPNEWP